MEEKKSLTKEELDQLNEQYFELTKTLQGYRDGMKSKNYRKQFDQFQRNEIEKTYKFFKFSLNEGLKTLIDQDGLKITTAFDAMGNRFVKLLVKWRVYFYIRRK